jgi:Na+/H+-translocating membrane pyrophosphatase
MTKKNSSIAGKAIVAGAAIGSAAVAAALLYASKRKDKAAKPASPPKTPTGENPETD